MRKLFSFCCGISIVSALIISGNQGAIYGNAQTTDLPKRVYVGGQTAGFLLNMGGVQVIAINEFNSKDGVVSPAKDIGLQAGDIICKVNGQKIESVNMLNKELCKSNGNTISITVQRNNELIEFTTQPKADKSSGKYKLGVLIRDTVSGIGTVTYIDTKNHRFGALGHGVYNEDNSLLTVGNEMIYDCNIMSVVKGERGKAGELKGIFTGQSELGKADTINERGLYGEFNVSCDLSGYEAVEVLPMTDVHIGEAYIYSTVSGSTPQKYKISIVKIDEHNEENKNFVVKITDPELIERTGGIVQGMSGSPILQDGKLIGALTHVFLNDPTRGYGIGIENMLESK